MKTNKEKIEKIQENIARAKKSRVVVSMDVEGARFVSGLLTHALRLGAICIKQGKDLPPEFRMPDSAFDLVKMVVEKVGGVEDNIRSAVYEWDKKEFESFVPMGGFGKDLFKKTMKGLRKGGKIAR